MLKAYIISTVYFCRFGAFEWIRGFLVDERGQMSNSGKLLSGLGAGVCEAILAVTPMETIKVKFINDQRSPNPKFKGFFHGTATIIKSEGKLLSPKSIQIVYNFFVYRYNRNLQRSISDNTKAGIKSSNTFFCYGIS